MKFSNNPADIDKDLRDAIITDLKINAQQQLQNVSGILVTGDIAYSGTTHEYGIAKEYLNEISNIFSIKPNDIYCVPGNHDINQTTIKESHIIYKEQCEIYDCLNIDDADKAFNKSVTDSHFNTVLFESIREYNEFANQFNCNISPEKITWNNDFELDHGLKLKIYGINSCFLSNKDDHQKDQPDRLMYIGQFQIPPYVPDTAVLLLCHHPPECWRFKDDIVQKINKRADIQLYGHMHDQSITLTENNVHLFSGAAHPSRITNWKPRYNWLTINSCISNGNRCLEIEIYPRILSENRNNFISDIANCTNGNSIHHFINLDNKRKQDLEDGDIVINQNEENIKIMENYIDVQESILHTDINFKINERDLIYHFYNLSVVRQMELFNKLELILEADKTKSISSLLNDIIERSKQQNKLYLLWDELTKLREI